MLKWRQSEKSHHQTRTVKESLETFWLNEVWARSINTPYRKCSSQFGFFIAMLSLLFVVNNTQEWHFQLYGMLIAWALVCHMAATLFPCHPYIWSTSYHTLWWPSQHVYMTEDNQTKFGGRVLYIYCGIMYKVYLFLYLQKKQPKEKRTGG